MSESLVVSIGPHIKDDISTKKIMWAVAASLVPAGAAGVFIFGIRALLVIILSIASAMITEAIILGMRKKDTNAVWDGSALLTGLLLAYNMPPQVPLWMPVIGSFFAVAIGKQVFGGLGHNLFNPALVGRAFLMISWPVYMTTWQGPRWQADGSTLLTINSGLSRGIDAVTGATPLALYKNGAFGILNHISNWGIFLGNRPGCIGEVCVAALLAGAAYLFVKRYITWHVPVTYMLTVGSLSWIFNGRGGLFSGDAIFFMISGGMVLGAFFMATDYVTSPLGAKGRIVFGIGCGILTFIIRKFSGYPEGVCYAILMMNSAVPLIDKYTFPRWFGWRK
jgi:electron transport complex protein RnfD